MLRYIKLKEILGELENLTPEEKLFFKLHENLHENSLGRLCDENNSWIIKYDFENGYFWYHYDRFYFVFKQKLDIKHEDFNDLCKAILTKHLNCKELTPFDSIDERLYISKIHKLIY